ncbi:hypothetical protein [Pseudomonas brassicacearum]|nr:hypothetical protein [Pseudomonas brassicacearum]
MDRKKIWRGLLLVLTCVVNFSAANERCGMLAGNVIAFDSSYTFLPVTYKGVNYWGGEDYKNSSKGCADPISAIGFVVTYPEFGPPGRINYYLGSNRGNAALNVYERKKDDGILITLLYRELENFELSSEAARRLAINNYQNSIFNKRLGLFRFQIISKTMPYRREVFWSKKNDTVDAVFDCETFPKAQAVCDQYWFHPKFEVFMKASYVRGRLSHWRAIKMKSEMLLDSFIRKEK